MKYDVNTICFGEMFYNLGDDGVYFSSPDAFQKIIKDNEVKYKEISGSKIYSGYSANSDKNTGVNELASLSSIIGDSSKKYVSKTMIKLYLAKYKILLNSQRKKNISEYQAEKKSK